jgi:ubiquitin carboxyl-terminal hydrolase 7
LKFSPLFVPLAPARNVLYNFLIFFFLFQEHIPIPPPEKTKEDVLLFFKLYNPEKEELR